MGWLKGFTQRRSSRDRALIREVGFEGLILYDTFYSLKSLLEKSAPYMFNLAILASSALACLRL